MTLSSVTSLCFLLHTSVTLPKGIPWSRMQTWPSQGASSQPMTDKEHITHTHLFINTSCVGFLLLCYSSIPSVVGASSILLFQGLLLKEANLRYLPKFSSCKLQDAFKIKTSQEWYQYIHYCKWSSWCIGGFLWTTLIKFSGKES